MTFTPELVVASALEHARGYSTPRGDDVRRQYTQAQVEIAVRHALNASGIAELTEERAQLLKCVRLLWQFHEPGDIPEDLGILVPELLAKIGGNQ